MCELSGNNRRMLNDLRIGFSPPCLFTSKLLYLGGKRDEKAQSRRRFANSHFQYVSCHSVTNYCILNHNVDKLVLLYDSYVTSYLPVVYRDARYRYPQPQRVCSLSNELVWSVSNLLVSLTTRESININIIVYTYRPFSFYYSRVQSKTCSNQ
jgi:hypothetical protein